MLVVVLDLVPELVLGCPGWPGFPGTEVGPGAGLEDEGLDVGPLPGCWATGDPIAPETNSDARSIEFARVNLMVVTEECCVSRHFAHRTKVGSSIGLKKVLGDLDSFQLRKKWKLLIVNKKRTTVLSFSLM